MVDKLTFPARRTGALMIPLAICATVACSSGSALAVAGKSPCTRYVSPRGSDRRGRGTRQRPFRTLVRLDAALRPGQTGCLLSGVYGGIHTKYWLKYSGSRRGQLTIRPAPGARVKVKGWIILTGSHTTLTHLNIDGSNDFYRRQFPRVGCPMPVSQGLTISGHNDVLEYSNVYQSVPSLRSVGIGIGWTGNAYGTIIRHNRLHDFGKCLAFDSIIYLDRGNNVQIYGNWMWNDLHGRGVQLYPGPTNARVWDNVIDHTGSGFIIADTGATATSGNQVFDNIVMNSVGLPWENQRGYAVTTFWGGKPGAGNAFFDNISYNNPGGVARTARVRLSGNRRLRPLLADPTTHDYRMLVPLTTLLRR
jgi:hypothetical protein